MLRVGICLIDWVESQKLEKELELILEQKSLKYELECFLDTEACLKYLQKHGALHLLFADVANVENLDSEAMKRLKGFVFEEGMELVLAIDDTYDLKKLPLHRRTSFLPNPFSQEKINHFLQDYLISNTGAPEFLRLSFGKEKITLRCSRVLYFTSCGKKVTVVCGNGERLETYGSLTEVERTIESDMFCRTHKSFIVNMRYVEMAKKDEIILLDGTRIPISRANKKKVEAWIKNSRLAQKYYAD